MSTTTTTKVAKAKDSAKPAAGTWSDFNKDGYKTRNTFTLTFKGDKNSATAYVPYTAVEFKTLADAQKYISNDEKKLKKYIEAGINNEARQAASMSANKITSMVDNLLALRPKLSRAKAEQIVKASLAAE